MINVGKKINQYLDLEKWPGARQLILKALKREPKDHWLLTRLATTYYEEHRYTKALAISKQALKLAPQCPLVLWDYACVLDMLGYDRRAIKICRQLLKRGVGQIAYDECGEGLQWARSLINDCRYLLGATYYDVGDVRSSIRYIRSHLAHRGQGIPSIYSRTSVKKRLAELLRKRK